MFQGRFYRSRVNSGLFKFTVTDGESDIFISCEGNLEKQAVRIVRKLRNIVANYIRKYPEFEKSLVPLKFDKSAPQMIRSMLKSSIAAGVGPMASVAGAIAEYLGRELLNFTEQIIEENGGDIFLKSHEERIISIYAGDSILSGKLALKIKSKDTPLAVCTSSGTVGHSLSFGRADAVTILAKDGALSDACATATCNMIKYGRDIGPALEFAKNIEGVLGAVVIYRNKIGSIGSVELVRIA